MQTITYRDADRALVGAMPELAAPVARCIEEYEEKLQFLIFEDVLACFIEILLAMPASPMRDELLRRAFAFVERMLQCDDSNVANLGFIAVLEGRSAWWLARAMPFLGPVAIANIDAYRPGWRGEMHGQAQPDAEREIIDLYGARDVIAEALEAAGVHLVSIPGITSPRAWTRYASLREARQDADGTVLLSCFGTSRPYVICPARSVTRDESVLLDLARDLASIEDREPNQREKAQSAFFRLISGERVWNMRTDESQHGRYQGTLWIHPELRDRGLTGSIEEVLHGKRRRLQTENAHQGNAGER